MRFRALLPAAATGLAALVAASPAHAVPERFTDAGTIVWCEGDGAHLTAIDTTQAGATASAGLALDGGFAVAAAEEPVLSGGRLAGRLPAYDADSGADLGYLLVDGAVTHGETETLDGWDIDEDGRRYRTEGTRTPLAGVVTLAVGDTTARLDCWGWEIDQETFRLSLDPAAESLGGWWPEGHDLGGIGTVAFYGDRRTEVGLALDLSAPAAFAGERLQVRNGMIQGDLLLRDPETWAVTGVAHVTGTVRRTGEEEIVETGPGYRRVTTLVHHEVTLTVSLPGGTYSGTYPATYETTRTVSVVPPKAA